MTEGGTVCMTETCRKQRKCCSLSGCSVRHYRILFHNDHNTPALVPNIYTLHKLLGTLYWKFVYLVNFYTSNHVDLRSILANYHSESYEYRILGYYAGETTPWEFCISQHGICRPTHLDSPWEFFAIVHHFVAWLRLFRLRALRTASASYYLRSPCSNRLPHLLAFSLSSVVLHLVLFSYVTDVFIWLLISLGALVLDCSARAIRCLYIITRLMCLLCLSSAFCTGLHSLPPPYLRIPPP